MDKKILLFSLTVLTACALLVRGVKNPSTAPAAAPSATAAAVELIRSTDSPSSAAASSTGHSDGNVSAPVPRAIAATTNDSSAEAMLAQMQAETAAKQAELNRWRERAARDLKGALAALATVPESPDRGQIVQAICSTQIKENPALAVEMAQSLQPSTSVVQELVQQWAQNDSAAAFAWASTQPPGFARDNMLNEVATALSGLRTT